MAFDFDMNAINCHEQRNRGHSHGPLDLNHTPYISPIFPLPVIIKRYYGLATLIPFWTYPPLFSFLVLQSRSLPFPSNFNSSSSLFAIRTHFLHSKIWHPPRIAPRFNVRHVLSIDTSLSGNPVASPSLQHYWQRIEIISIVKFALRSDSGT